MCDCKNVDDGYAMTMMMIYRCLLRETHNGIVGCDNLGG